MKVSCQFWLAKLAGALTAITDELGCPLHAGPAIAVIAKMEGPNASAEHSRVFLKSELEWSEGFIHDGMEWRH